MSYSRTAIPLSSYLAAITLILGALLLSSCGAGGGGGGGGAGTGTSGGTPRDPAGSTAAVDQGVGDLQDLASSATIPPYDTIANISDTFQKAADLDPQNPTAAFFASVANVVLFLDSDAGKAFLNKVGWQDFRTNDTDFQNFITSIGATISAFTSTTTTGPIPWPVADPTNFTIGPDGDVTLADLIQFFSVTLPVRLQTSIDLLGTIPPDWTYSITITLPSGGGDQPAEKRKTLDTGEGTTITIGYTEAMALRAAFSALQAGLAVPSIWNYTGADQFYVDNKDITDDPTLSTNIENYFAGPNQPLSNNPAGVTQVISSLDSFLDSFTNAIVSLRADQESGTPDPTRLLAIEGVFSGDLMFDAQAATISYSLDAFGLTATDLKAVLKAPGKIGVYQPVAFIQNFTTCAPLAASDINYDPAVAAPTDLATLVQIGSNFTTVPTDGTETAPAFGPITGTDYYFQFVLSAPANISIYTTGSTATSGAVAYSAGKGGELVGWDSDAGSADGTNFGISIDSAYFTDNYQATSEGINATSPVTMWVRVVAESTDFRLVVIQNPTGGETSPIFLKGGGGRMFTASTYRIGQVTNANLGNVVKTAGKLFDLSNTRSSLLVDTSQSFPVTQLLYDIPTITAQAKTILPSLTFQPPLNGTGNLNIVDFETWSAGLPENIDSLIDLTPVVVPTDTEMAPFCAYPKDLMQARLFVGGHSIGIGF